MKKVAKTTLKLMSLFVVLGVFSTGTVVAEEFDAAAKYAQSCAVCHNSGAAGAPKKGDAAAWAERNKKGADALLANVKNGVGAMPAMGLCADCSDDNFRALIKHLSE